MSNTTKHRKQLNNTTSRVIEVHRMLGPGLLESVYEQCLVHELDISKIPIKIQWSLPVETRLDCGYRVDVLVDDRVNMEYNKGIKCFPYN